MRCWIFTCVVLLLTSCTQQSVTSTKSDSGVESKKDSKQLIWPLLPLLPSNVELPPGWTLAELHWNSATKAFGQHRYEDAAFDFIRAATALQIAKSRKTARIRTSGRCLAYENAIHALRLDKKYEKALKEIDRLLELDPPCQHSLALQKTRTERALSVR